MTETKLVIKLKYANTTTGPQIHVDEECIHHYTNLFQQEPLEKYTVYGL
jgi:hypothetical protein